MIGARPQPYRTPQATPGIGDPVAEVLAGPEPFVWGHGGLKMSPAQAAAMRERGLARTRTDYSPIQHWTQGLARVSDNIFGALEAKRADKALEASAEADRGLMEAMVAGGVDDATIARALMDPNVGDGVKQFAGMEYQRRMPAKAPAPTELEKLMAAAGIERGSDEWNSQINAELLNRRDPFTTFTGPTVGYTGRQSGLAAALGGGDSSGAAPTGSPPAEAVAALKRGEGTPEQFDEMFGPGAAARVMGGGGGGNVTSGFLDGL